MNIMTFLLGAFRIVTNHFLSDQEKAAYEASVQTNRPQKVEGRVVDLYAFTQGQWWHSLLLNKLHKRGKKFRLASIDNKTLKALCAKKRLNLQEMVDQSTFAWANATTTFFLMVEGEADFGLRCLGVYAKYSKKTPKRLQEISRLTEMATSGKMRDLDYTMCDTVGVGELAYDGPIFIRKSFALQMANRIKDDHKRRHMRYLIHNGSSGPMLFRLLMKSGKVKGLAHIVDDGNLDSDVVFHKTALKTEINMNDGFFHAVAFRMKHLYKSVWNIQTAVNNHSWLYTEDKFMSDLGTIVPELVKAMEKGEIPEWILHQEQDDHGDEDSRIQEHVTAYWEHQARKIAALRWQMNQFSVDASASILRMAYGSVYNQMKASLANGRMWLPVTNAFSATVITVEALRDMGGYDMDTYISENDLENKVFFMPNVGVVFPAKRFIETQELHDTWDSDGDTVSLERIRLWSSDPSVTEARREYCIIPEDMDVPSTPEEAIDACVAIRSPNSPGGYSIEQYDAASMPWMRETESIIVIDLANTPPSLMEMLDETDAQPLHSTKRYSNAPMTREDALEAIEAQWSNPGIGSYANAIMVWASVHGPSMPDFLPFQGNDLIDLTAQTSDLTAFQEAKEGVDCMWEFMSRMHMDVDKYIYDNRVPDKVKKEHNWTIVDGPWTRMHEAYVQTAIKVQRLVNEQTFQIRQNSNFVKFMRSEIPTLSPETKEWAKQFFEKYEKMLAEVAAMFAEDEETGKKNRFQVLNESSDRSELTSNIVAQMVKELQETAYPGKYAMALYRWITDPGMTRSKYGVSDRIIFQGGKPGQKTVMDIMIEGLLAQS